MAAAAYFETVQKIYIAFYQRPADPAGLKYWAEQIDLAGGNPNAVITAFGTQPESIALYGEVTAANIGTVLDKIYQAAFSRTPAEAEKAYWTEQFNAGGITASSMALAVVLGAQNADAASVANKLTVANEFTKQVDGRALTDAGFGTAPFQVTYNGDADADAARVILKPVTGDAATILTPAQITTQIKATIADAGDPINSVTQALTTGVDTLVGGVAGDVFTGVASALTAENTLNALDQIDGGAGVDTLKVDLKSNFTGFTGTGKLANVENIELTNSGAISRSFDATGVTGATKYVLNAGESNISLSNLAAAGVTVDVVGQKAGTTTIGFTAKAVEGAADALTLGLNKVGTAEVKDAAGVVTTAQQSVAVTTTAGLETIALNATGANIVDLTNANAGKLTVTGEGTLKVTAVGSAMTSFDASAAKGAITADLSAATTAGAITAIKGGAADDAITVNAAGLAANVTLDGGAGNNTLTIKGGSGTIQPTMTGFQTLGFNGLDNDVILSGKNATGLNTISLTTANALSTKALTVSNLAVADLTVKSTGAQTAATITLTPATNLTYTTAASAAATTAKLATPEAVATVISADSATNATINVGAYTSQTGAITVNKATAVTLNVASGKTADLTPVEATSFDANLTANAAQSVVVKADGKLGVTAAKTITAGAATLLDVTATAGGDMAFATVKAQQVKITAGAALDIAGSTFTAAEQVTIAANVGLVDGLTGTAVNLGKISTLNLSGTGTAATKLSQIKLGTLGGADITNAITVTATGLKGGAEVGIINTKAGNVNLTATEMTGHFKTGDIGGLIGGVATKVGNVTVNAATLGSTEIGNIDTVEGATVQINATGLLGKSAAGEALKVGNVTVANSTAAGNPMTGTITATISGSNKLNIGDLSAKTVTVDASSFLGEDIVKGTNLGAITGQNITFKGSEIKVSTVEATLALVAAQTSSLNVTGGLGGDTLTLTSAVAVDKAATISFAGSDGADKIVFEDDVNLSATNSKLTLSSVETVEIAAGKTLTVKAADITGQEFTVAGTGATGALVVNGTTAADTIDLSKLTTGTNASVAINGLEGNDTIKGSATVQTITGGKGVDVMTGGGGADVFVFAAGDTGTPTTTNFDIITDYTKTAGTNFDTIKAGTLVLGIQIGTAGAGVATITAGVATFNAADTTFAQHLVAAEAALYAVAGTPTAGATIVWQEGANSYVYISDAVAGVGADDVLIQLTGVTAGALTVGGNAITAMA